MVNFAKWLLLYESVDPYFLDDPVIGLQPKDKVKNEFHILFSVLSAGKPSFQQARGLQFFLGLEEGDTPFEKIRNMISKGVLVRNLMFSGLGFFNQIARTFVRLSKIDLDVLIKASDEEIEDTLLSIPNIGSKIVNFILLLKDGKERAVLDRHILTAMRTLLLKMAEKGQKLPKKHMGNYKSLKRLALAVPSETPAANKYKFWGDLWLYLMKKFDLKDIDVWRRKAIIGIDPYWKWKPIRRGYSQLPTTVDEKGRDIINLSNKYRSRLFDLEMNPYTGKSGEFKFTDRAGLYDPEGKVVPSEDYEVSTEADEYAKRWVSLFRKYQDLGLYDDFEREKDRSNYERYARKMAELEAHFSGT